MAVNQQFLGGYNQIKYKYFIIGFSYWSSSTLHNVFNKYYEVSEYYLTIKPYFIQNIYLYLTLKFTTFIRRITKIINYSWHLYNLIDVFTNHINVIII